MQFRVQFRRYQNDIGIVVMKLHPSLCKVPVDKCCMPPVVVKSGNFHRFDIDIVLFDEIIDHIPEPDVGMMDVDVLGVTGNSFDVVFDLILACPQKSVHLVGIVKFSSCFATRENLVMVDFDRRPIAPFDMEVIR